MANLVKIRCPKCGNEFQTAGFWDVVARDQQHPVWKIIHSVAVTAIIVIWMLPYTQKWDTEPWMLVGFFATVVGYAFGGDALKALSQFKNRGQPS